MVIYSIHKLASYIVTVAGTIYLHYCDIAQHYSYTWLLHSVYTLHDQVNSLYCIMQDVQAVVAKTLNCNVS